MSLVLHDVDPEPAGWAAEDAPRRRPLTYPGRWPEASVLLTATSHRRLAPGPDRLLGPEGLDEVLRGMGEPGMDERTAVLAVGSNAAPAQLRHKFMSDRETASSRLVVPLVQTEVRGLAAGVAALVAPYGSLPATPIFGADRSDALFVQWLDRSQLALMDETEGGYTRVRLDQVRVSLPTGERVEPCDVYVCDAGALVDVVAGDGSLRRLTDQSTLMTELLTCSRALTDVLGETPTSWVETIRADPRARRAARQVFRFEGWVRDGGPPGRP